MYGNCTIVKHNQNKKIIFNKMKYARMLRESCYETHIDMFVNLKYFKSYYDYRYSHLPKVSSIISAHIFLTAVVSFAPVFIRNKQKLIMLIKNRISYY